MLLKFLEGEWQLVIQTRLCCGYSVNRVYAEKLSGFGEFVVRCLGCNTRLHIDVTRGALWWRRAGSEVKVEVTGKRARILAPLWAGPDYIVTLYTSPEI